VTNLNYRSQCTQIEFPVNHMQAQRKTLRRLYERKATLEALIESLEAYARCRSGAAITTLPSVPTRGN
jgi:hypothetical protein